MKQRHWEGETFGKRAATERLATTWVLLPIRIRKQSSSCKVCVVLNVKWAIVLYDSLSYKTKKIILVFFYYYRHDWTNSLTYLGCPFCWILHQEPRPALVWEWEIHGNYVYLCLISREISWDAASQSPGMTNKMLMNQRCLAAFPSYYSILFPFTVSKTFPTRLSKQQKRQ